MGRKPTGFSQSAYYREKKNEILFNKRKKYMDDPAYREAAKERSKRRHRDSDAITSKVSKNEFVINGVTYVTSGYIADAIGISKPALLYYHNCGVLPEPRTVANYKWRLYRLDYADAVITVMTDILNSDKPTKSIGDELCSLLGNDVFSTVTALDK